MSTQPPILTIAGSDPSGGAGIQADLKTIAALSGYGMSVLTGLTAQNTQGVQGVLELEPEFVEKQLDVLLQDITPKAIKTGMLSSAPIIKTLAQNLRKHGVAGKERVPIVVDPVTISTSNHALLPENAIGDLCFGLLPLARLITPNVPETQLILRKLQGGLESKDVQMGDKYEIRIDSLQAMLDAGRMILDLLKQYENDSGEKGARGMLVKGGHMPVPVAEVQEFIKLQHSNSDLASSSSRTTRLVDLQNILPDTAHEINCDDECSSFVEILQAHTKITSSPTKTNDTASTIKAPDARCVVDVLIDRNEAGDEEVSIFVAPEVRSSSTHGTGCTLSAAIATHLGQGLSLPLAVEASIRYIQLAIYTAPGIGKGHGPVNHQCISIQRALAPPTSASPHPFVAHLIKETKKEWRAYVRHPFVLQLGAGTLPVECFKHYIIQDWHYLKHYARVHALGAFKATSFAEIESFSKIALHITRESEMHVSFCESFGVSKIDLENATESPANLAYSRYIMDVGSQGDSLDLLVAVLSCLIGYGEVGLYLARTAQEGGQIKLEGNPYRKWMDDYNGKEFQDAVHAGIDNLERRIAADPPSADRLKRLTEIWRTCTQLEIGFWDMGLNLS